MMDERLRGFSVPFGISARWAAIVGSALATGMYALWLWALLRALAFVSLDQISSSVELQALRTFLKTSASLALINGLAAHSATLLALSVQHADALRHLSRFVWLLWLFDWMAAWTGILGFIFDSSLSSAGDWWRWVQIELVAAALLTLLVAFGHAYLLAAYVHTLHPHLFIVGGEDDSEEPLLPVHEPAYPSLRRRTSPAR